MKNKKMIDIQNHLKQTGFVFQGSEIYGGLANTWDYGPLGVLLKNNIRDAWWKEFVTKEPSNFGLDSKILLNPEVWKASGHVGNFNDPLVENKVNGKRYRADKIIEEIDPSINAETLSFKEMDKFLENVKEYDNSKTEWSKVKEFHLMFETKQGITDESSNIIYLRPETAQGIFINFKNVQRSTRAKLPFGIAQVGKSFRNEVTPGNFTFRTREFEQMELEVFSKEEDGEKLYRKYIDKSFSFVKNLGLKEESLRLREHDKEELAHYAKGTTDVEFKFPFGWGELLGIANRGTYDLKAHAKASKEDLSYRDPITNEVITPNVVEPSMGLDRLMLAILIDAYDVEQLEKDERIVLRLNKDIAPYKVAVLPLNKKYHSESAKKVFATLVDKGLSVTYDEAGSIGKRYRRQDAIGTPLVITVIDETEKDESITIRFRDDMSQKEINLKELNKYL